MNQVILILRFVILQTLLRTSALRVSTQDVYPDKISTNPNNELDNTEGRRRTTPIFVLIAATVYVEDQELLRRNKDNTKNREGEKIYTTLTSSETSNLRTTNHNKNQEWLTFIRNLTLAESLPSSKNGIILVCVILLCFGIRAHYNHVDRLVQQHNKIIP